MGDNGSSSSDSLETGRLVLSTEDNSLLDCLQQFLCGLIEGRRKRHTNVLVLELREYTQVLNVGKLRSPRLLVFYAMGASSSDTGCLIVISDGISWGTLRAVVE
jgi:hypothetical protein